MEINKKEKLKNYFGIRIKTKKRKKNIKKLQIKDSNVIISISHTNRMNLSFTWGIFHDKK